MDRRKIFALVGALLLVIAVIWDRSDRPADATITPEDPARPAESTPREQDAGRRLVREVRDMGMIADITIEPTSGVVRITAVDRSSNNVPIFILSSDFELGDRIFIVAWQKDDGSLLRLLCRDTQPECAKIPSMNELEQLRRGGSLPLAPENVPGGATTRPN